MHPIVMQFIETDRHLVEIVEELHDPHDVVEQTLNELLKHFNKPKLKNKHLFDLINRSILLGHKDSSFYYLFLTICASTCLSVSRLVQVKTIFSIADNFDQEQLPPTLKSYYFSYKAFYYKLQYNGEKSEEYIQKCLACIDSTSNRFKTILIGVAVLYAYGGRFYGLSEEYQLYLSQIKGEQNLYNYTNLVLINFIYIGKVEDAIQIRKKTSNSGEQLKNHYDSIIKILSGNFNINDYEIEPFKKLSLSYQYLLDKNYPKARELSKELLEEEKFVSYLGMFIEFYLPLHIALCERDKGLARYIYHTLEKRYNLSYMKDFFLARLLLLEESYQNASIAFSRLLENVRKYRAWKRLQFELQFAHELNTSNIFSLLEYAHTNFHIPKLTKEKVINEPAILVKNLVGNSVAMKNIIKLIKKYADIRDCVLITGETGTGKELIARALHQQGKQPDEPFLAINCMALTESLLESELFGFEAGAFTGAQKERKGIFEAAGKGTVFLDEFGEISSKLQGALLRVLESNEIRMIGGVKTRPIHCKIIVATNVDLLAAVEAKNFRQDLYFRVNRFEIKTVPLRERKEDLPILIDYFLNQNKEKNELPFKVTSSLMDAFFVYSWPGNVRELKNEIERMKILNPDKNSLDIQDFVLKDSFSSAAKTSLQLLENQKNEDIKSLKKETEEERAERILNEPNETEKRRLKIQELFQRHKKITRLQLAKILNISLLTTTRDLQKLCEDEFIEKVTPSKSVRSHYFQLKD